MRSGQLSQQQALRLVRTALRRAETVRKLLRALGDHDETTALAERVRRATRRVRRAAPDPKSAELYGRLTVAFHRLGLLLSRSFYPRARPGTDFG
jgi:hypothetical protein